MECQASISSLNGGLWGPFIGFLGSYKNDHVLTRLFLFLFYKKPHYGYDNSVSFSMRVVDIIATSGVILELASSPLASFIINRINAAPHKFHIFFISS